MAKFLNMFRKLTHLIAFSFVVVSANAQYSTPTFKGATITSATGSQSVGGTNSFTLTTISGSIPSLATSTGTTPIVSGTIPNGTAILISPSATGTSTNVGAGTALTATNSLQLGGTAANSFVQTTGSYPTLYSGSSGSVPASGIQSGTSNAVVSATGWTVGAAATGTATSLSGTIQATGSNVIYVTVSGNDSSGIRGDIGHPFATGSAAALVMQDGDTMRFGPGTFQGFEFGSGGIPIVQYPKVIGSGYGEYAPDWSHINGGTRFISTIGASISGTTVIYGPQWSDFSVDSGPAVTGSGYAGGVFAFGPDALNLKNVSVVDWRLSNVRALGPGTASATYEGIDLYTGSNGNMEHIRVAKGGQMIVMKSGYTNISDVIGVDNYASCIVNKNAGQDPNARYWASHNNYSNIQISSTWTSSAGINISDYTANNNPPLENISISNYFANIPNGNGIGFNLSGTTYNVSGFNVSNYECYGQAFGMSAPSTNPPSGSFTNCTAYNSNTGWQASGNFAFNGCRAISCQFGFDLYNKPGLPSFSNCTAENCAYGVRAVGPGLFTLNNPIVVSGTYAYPYTAVAGGKLNVLPTIYRQTSPATAVTSSTFTDLWAGQVYGPYGYPVISGTYMPYQCFTVSCAGTYAVSGSGTNTFTWTPYFNGATVGGGLNDIAVTLNNGEAGGWKLQRDFYPGVNVYSPGSTEFRYCFSTLEINGRIYSSFSNGSAQTGPTDDLTLDEQGKWNNNNSGNSIQCQKATIVVKPDSAFGQ